MVTLHIDGLEYGYSADPVFSGVTLELHRGEVVSVVGRNGAGKSTLLKCLNRIIAPRKGTVLIDGNEVAHLPQHLRARRFGYLSQKSEQLFSSTVFEVVLAGRYPHSPVRFTRRDEEITAETLAMLELDEFASRPFNRLSGGEQQQVCIARALAQEADILLFDEPTNNLDLKHQLQIMQLIRKLAREKNITSILAIHDLNFAAAYSDRLIVLHGGRVFANGTPVKVVTPEVIREAFGVEAKIYDHHGVPHIAVVHR
jgi:iron complex transport system ATP-binding protein